MMTRGFIIRLAFFLALLLALLGYGMYVQVKLFLFEPIHLSEPVQVEIIQGESMSSIAHKLADLKLTPNADIMAYYARYRGLDSKIKAGIYQLEGSVDADDILNKLVSGKVKYYKFTVPEGVTYDTFIDLLMQHEQMQDKQRPEFSDWYSASDTVHGQYTHPEGLLFPSTYHFTYESPAQLARYAFEIQLGLLNKLWSTRPEDLPYRTPYEALIMASIIQKETSLVEEMPEIAGVFVRRLQKGMRLQTDPTVIYGIKDTFDGNITRAHLREKTPYNTYVIDGLPPTPIALAGVDALAAAIYPEHGESLFFVAKGDGSHAFSNTYEEHLRNVKKYQLKQ